MSESEGSSQLLADSTTLQKVSGICAAIFAGAAVVMVAYWAHGPNTSKGYLGGLDMEENTFNWHPVLMVTGGIFCLMTSLLSYRVLPLPKTMQKAMHGVMHTAAFICLSIGLACVFRSKNIPEKNPFGGYSSNLKNIHSFIGLGVYILYGLNYLLGILHYAIPGIDLSMKRAYMNTHVFIGIFIMFGAVCAVESGLMMLTGGCGYPVTSADTNPAENYHLLSNGCQLANAIGIVVFLASFLCYYALFRGNSTPKEKNEEPEKAEEPTKV